MYYILDMIVFDASTLILLVRIELIELSVSSYQGRVVIPQKVMLEVCAADREETPLIEDLIKRGKIDTLKATNFKQKRKLIEDFHIDEGEAEALLLAIQSRAKLIATDDRNAIRASKLLKIDFVTAIGFLIRAFEKKLIDRDEALSKLHKLEFIARYSRAIIKDAKKKIKGGN